MFYRGEEIIQEDVEQEGDVGSGILAKNQMCRYGDKNMVILLSENVRVVGGLKREEV